MAIKLGTSDISKVYLGATEVSKIYLGVTEIYSGVSGASLFAAYKTRAEADGGTVENDTCAIAYLDSIIGTAYDNAKLILYPSGYKASKVYSLKPTNGNGDFAFARSTTKTYEDATNTIDEAAINVMPVSYEGGGCGKFNFEPQRTNLITQFEQLNNAAWTSNNGNVTANTDVAPDGNTTMDTFTDNTTTNFHRVYVTSGISVNFGATCAFSVYLKYGSMQYVNVAANATANNYWFCTVDLINGTITHTGAGGSGNYGGSSIEQIGDFYKITLIGNDDVRNIYYPMFLSSNSATPATYDPSFLGSSKTFKAWGMQIEESSDSTSSIPTAGTSATRNADVGTVSPPAGTTQITETFKDGTTNVITTIPATYTVGEGEIQSVVMI